MRLWIKYDSVSFKAAETCQPAACFLTVSKRSDSSKAGVCLYLGRFSIFALFLHTAEHYFVPIVFETAFYLQGFVVFSLPISPSYDGYFLSFFSSSFFPVSSCCFFYSSVLAHLQALSTSFKQNPQPLAFPASCFLPPPSAPPPLSSPFFIPQGWRWRSLLCSWHLFCWVINWDEHVGWGPGEGVLRPPR